MDIFLEHTPLLAIPAVPEISLQYTGPPMGSYFGRVGYCKVVKPTRFERLCRALGSTAKKLPIKGALAVAGVAAFRALRRR